MEKLLKQVIILSFLKGFLLSNKSAPKPEKVFNHTDFISFKSIHIKKYNELIIVKDFLSSNKKSRIRAGIMFGYLNNRNTNAISIGASADFQFFSSINIGTAIMIKRADQLMYKSKIQGRNRVSVEI